MYPKFMGDGSDVRLKKSWELKYYLEIDTDNTSLAGRYNCQYSDKAEEVKQQSDGRLSKQSIYQLIRSNQCTMSIVHPHQIVHNVVVMGELQCSQNRMIFVAGRDKLDVNCSLPMWGAPGELLRMVRCMGM